MTLEELEREIINLKLKLDNRLEIQSVNTKWFIFVGLLILAFIGYSTFVSIPADAKKSAQAAVSEKVGPEVIKEIEKLTNELKKKNEKAQEIVVQLSELEKSWKDSDLPSQLKITNELIKKVGVADIKFTYDNGTTKKTLTHKEKQSYWLNIVSEALGSDHGKLLVKQ